MKDQTNKQTYRSEKYRLTRSLRKPINKKLNKRCRTNKKFKDRHDPITCATDASIGKKDTKVTAHGKQPRYSGDPVMSSF